MISWEASMSSQMICVIAISFVLVTVCHAANGKHGTSKENNEISLPPLQFRNDTLELGANTVAKARNYAASAKRSMYSKTSALCDGGG